MKRTDQYPVYLPALIIFFMLNLSGSACFAQMRQTVFDHVSTRDGLSQSTVNDILQDQNGFLWFATYDGLNKYDGYYFKIYRRNENDETTLSSNGFVRLFEDEDGYIYIGNISAGLDRFNPYTEVFENYHHDPRDSNSIGSNELFYIGKDSKGNLWICAGNTFNRFIPPDPENDQPGHFKRFYNTNPDSQISYFYEDRHGKLLVFSDSLYIFDYAQEALVNTGVALVSSLSVSVVKDPDGGLLVGTSQDGIYGIRYDSLNGTYEKTDAGKLNITPENRNHLYIDQDQKLWLGTELEGIYRYDFETERLEHFLPDKLDPTSICDNTIYSMYQDNSGVLWIGTFSQGLSKYDSYRKPFLHYKSIPFRENTLSGNVISSIHGLDPNDLWIGLDVGGGVNRILFSENRDPQIKKYMHDPKDLNTIGGNSTLCLVQRRNGDVWVGTAGGSISRIRPEPPYSDQKPDIKRYYLSKWTFALYEDSDGILWGGTWDQGLWRYNDITDTFDFFEPDPADSFSIADKIIWSIAEDRHKNIWIGAHDNGISILTADEKRKQSPKFINYHFEEDNPHSLSNNTVFATYQASDGNIWICTSEGLDKVLDEEEITGTFKDFPDLHFGTYYQDDGLPTNGIVGIAEDDSGNLWISTTNGISKMDPETGDFVNYSKDHGLQSNEFWHNAFFRNANGMLFFGGPNGLNAFYPEEILPNPFLPEVVLTELKLFNQTVSVGEEVNGQKILSTSFTKTKELELSYRNNDLSFQFAALHYAQPSLIRYAYYLEGYEDDWNYSGNLRSATYTNLDPGTYTFRVKATNNDGIWSDKEVALQITIRPPWWQTLIVKILAPVLALLIILLIFRIRLRWLKEQRERLRKLVTQRTVELQEANATLEERQEEVLLQNEELLHHRNNLEGLVEERTHQLEKAKLKAEESDRLKSSFLANMSHEIRTPMNAILGFSTLLDDQEFTEEERRSFIQSIQSNGEALMVLIDDILDISMIESDQLTFAPRYFDLNTILLEMVDYCHMNNKNQLSIEFANRNSKELILYLDPVRLRQIMINLLSNALKYTENGFVRFGYEKSEDEIRFFVEDSGIGIDPQYQDTIFEHFYKIELKTTQIYSGTGIGLAICKRLIGLLNGKIWLESAPGKGTTFYFSIPYAGYPKPTDQNKARNTASNAFPSDKLFFVIAEDEPANFEVLVRMLHIPEERLVWAKNGKEAVDFVRENSTRKNMLVLMDIKMPEMDGYEAMKQIKEINPKIPVVAITAFALKHEKEAFLSKGFDAYIGKPVTRDKLIKELGRFFGAKNNMSVN